MIRESLPAVFLADGENVLLLDPPGVGKTHLAVALGLKACELGHRTTFTTTAGLITTLGKALYENRVEERLKLLTRPKLLIIDEIGYIPIDRQRVNLFSSWCPGRYERGCSILLTSNLSLGAWGFRRPVIASAIPSTGPAQPPTVNIKGESYRLKEKRRAGLLHTGAAPRAATRDHPPR